MPASRLQTDSASSTVGASAITRTNGSVPDGRGAGNGLALGYLYVEEDLRQLLHRNRAGKVLAAELSHRRQRGANPVAGGDDPGVDDVPRLLAADRPAPPTQLIEDVAVADRGRRHLDSGLLHRAMEAVIAHHRDRDTAAELA